MQLSDFIKNFHSLDICNVTPDDLNDKTISWGVSTAQAEWKLKVTAGGRISSREIFFLSVIKIHFQTRRFKISFYFSASFYKNPQFHLEVQDYDVDDDDEASFIVQVIQKDCRRRGIPYLTLGMVIYKIPPGTQLPLDENYLSKTRPVELVAQYRPQPTPLRMIVERFAEGPGHYVIIPTTWSIPSEDRKFMVRIFSEAPHISHP